MSLSVLCCGLVPLLAGLFLLAAGMRGGNPFGTNPQALPIAVGAVFLPPFLMMPVGFYQLASGYRGLCESPPDYSVPCSYTEYLHYNLFMGVGALALTFVVPILLGWVSLVFGLVAFHFRKR